MRSVPKRGSVGYLCNQGGSIVIGHPTLPRFGTDLMTQEFEFPSDRSDNQQTEETGTLMATDQPTVADIFRRAQAIRDENPQASYKELQGLLAGEYAGKPFPPLYNLTIPEQDARAPEEDWTAGLPLVRRGIQSQDWNEIAAGIVLSLEQTENYERERGPEGDRDKWHDRSVGVSQATAKGIGKWMPEELIKLAEQKSRH